MDLKEYFDIIPKLYATYPDIDPKVIKYIVKTGFYNMSTNLARGYSIKFKSGIIFIPKGKEALRRASMELGQFLYKLNKRFFNNEYYFAVSRETKKNVTCNKNGIWTIKNVYCTKDINKMWYDEAWKVYAIELTDVGMNFHIDKLRTDRVRLIMKRNRKNELIKV